MAASAVMLTGALLLLYVLLTGPSLLGSLSDLIGARHVRALLLLVGAATLVAILRARRPAAPVRAGLPEPEPGPTSSAGRGLRWLADRARVDRGTVRSIPSGALRVSPPRRCPVGRGLRGAHGRDPRGRRDVDVIAMATVYVGIQVLRQIPLTPGGIGIIEAALLAGLIAAGAAAAPAAAAVLIYRVLTFG